MARRTFGILCNGIGNDNGVKLGNKSRQHSGYGLSDGIEACDVATRHEPACGVWMAFSDVNVTSIFEA